MGTSDRLTLTVLTLLASACATAPSALRGATTSPSLIAPDGSQTTLAAVTSSHEATVLVFWSAGCPCVRRYQARVDAIAARYASSRVRVIGLSSNAGEHFTDAQRVAMERGVQIPLYRDEGGAVASLVGARSTPTVAVLDPTGRVRFLGWVDNEREPGDQGREPWLERALDGVLSQRRFVARTPTWGCTITKSLFTPEAKACTVVH
ncbi:MAG: redoxin family protein [Myxococcaceae bacterium]|jgi:hypothetical protein|nr:redoxin family protein [Myxococcaceae bacterium]